ncbi:MAG TPA: hypothetical protein V6C81_22635 [Planktothrix sp.]|jgi:hypothetical protein
MSYDFELFRPAPEMDLTRALEQFHQEEEARVVSGAATPYDEAKEFAKKKIRDVLLHHNAKLIVTESHSKAKENSLEDCEKKSATVIQFDEPEEIGTGLQITLSDDSANVTVPYWHLAGEANAVFHEVWDYLLILEDEGGFRTYDPQVDHVLDLRLDFEKVALTYMRTSRAMAPTLAGKTEKPWWKFW